MTEKDANRTGTTDGDRGAGRGKTPSQPRPAAPILNRRTALRITFGAAGAVAGGRIAGVAAAQGAPAATPAPASQRRRM
jgi:hypothetical protein